MIKDFKKQSFMSAKFFCRITLLLTFLLVTVVSLVFFNWQLNHFKRAYTDLGREEGKMNLKTTSVLQHPDKLRMPKLVLFYTSLFGRTPWRTIENDYQFNNWNNIPCAIRNCKISYDKNDLNRSDAVLFHGQDIDHLDVSKLSKTVKHRAKQRWIFFIHENPIFFTKDLDTLKDVFNWTMTYRLDSDIFVPYGYYFSKSSKNLGNKVNSGSQNYSQGKDKLVAWMVSHCGKQRDKLVTKLMEYIPVHVYGGCARKFSQNRTCYRMDKNCLETLRRYKFYLAFENANCVDYISEKYWITSLQNNIVPVVLGGGNYSNRNLAVPGSFINVMDFKTVKDLADYLVMLDRNDTAYNEYFSWKDLYYVDVPPSWTCQMCAMLNNNSLPIKSYDQEHFKKFWSRKSNCGFLDDKLDKIVSGYYQQNDSNRTAD